MTKIKICGITGEDEIAALNETGVDYAGFVLYEKSKRYVTVQKARQLFGKLNKGIRKVAVTVAPERALIEDIGRAGFDLLQVHGVDAAEAERIAAQTKLPVWLAVNLRDPAEIRRWRREEYHRIAGIVLDAGAYGSGKTFGWEQDGQDEIFFQIPLILRQEYRFPAEKSSYPVTQEEPLQKDCTGAGTFLLTEENGEEQVIAEGISPMLDVEAAEADMELSVTAQNEKMKAGQTIRYQVEIANTGKLDLADIRLTSSLSCPKIRQMWEDAEGLLTEGAVAEFAELKAGESRNFYVQAPLLDEQEKDLEHQVEAEARVKGRAAEVIRKNATTINSLEALKADLSVKKTADKETAAPGETVTYQICIVNTGEKTLHSVVGTERFQAAGIHAQFLEQEGVTLNSSRTKAMIQQIPPGEAVSLQAVVKIPERTADQKLFNQVTVTSQETGERLMEASASVIVKGKITVTPEERLFVQSDDQDPASGQTQMARAASTHPKTEDDTRTDLWTLLAVTALVTVLGGIWLRKKYADIYEKS